jgi:hypothetical protein
MLRRTLFILLLSAVIAGLGVAGEVRSALLGCDDVAMHDGGGSPECPMHCAASACIAGSFAGLPASAPAPAPSMREPLRTPEAGSPPDPAPPRR